MVRIIATVTIANISQIKFFRELSSDAVAQISDLLLIVRNHFNWRKRVEIIRKFSKFWRREIMLNSSTVSKKFVVNNLHYWLLNISDRLLIDVCFLILFQDYSNKNTSFEKCYQIVSFIGLEQQMSIIEVI